MKQFPSGVRDRGYAIYRAGSVGQLAGNQWRANACVQGSLPYQVELSRDDDKIQAHCECPYFADQGLCKHVWATVVAADFKNYLLGRIGSRPPNFIVERERFEPLLDDGEPLDYDETPAKGIVKQREYGRSPVVRAPEPEPAWRRVLAQLPVTMEAARTEEAWRPESEIYYIIDVSQTLTGFGLHLEVALREPRKDGAWGKLKTVRIPRAQIAQIPDERDREALLILGGVPQPYDYNETSISHTYHLKHSNSRFVLPRLCATGRCRLRQDSTIPLESQIPLTWDDGPAWTFRMCIEQRDRNWVVRGYLERDQERMDLADAALVVQDGLVFVRGRIAALDHGGNFGWIALLRRTREIEIPLEQGHKFVVEILKKPSLPEIEWPEELRFERIVAPLRPVLKVAKPAYYWNSRNELWGSLSFNYDGRVFAADDQSRGVYEPTERRLWERDAMAEQAALERLAGLGLKRVAYNYGQSPGMYWAISAKKLPKVIRELVNDGWHIESEGKLFRNAGGFRAELTSGIDWFELHAEVEYGSEHVQLPELLRAIERGDNLVRLNDGSYGLVPEEVREKYGLLIRLGRKHEDHVRFSRSQAGLLDALLAGRAEIRVDQIFTRVREELQRFDGIVPAEQPGGFEGRLRDYQLEGLAWAHFLRQFGFGGCLADDMGVGKTAQVLALLETRRELRCAQRVNGAADPLIGPSLAVVPRSLVYNWKREAERFTPRLRVLDHTGVGRTKKVDELDNYDLVLTTYGTLRRDAAWFQGIRFDYIVLDEAQAIKNAATESAKAARLLDGSHRLALSGTPVENHVGELWSIFEFLNPGMLGAASVFQMAADNLRKPDEESRKILSKAVRPFILRRTKDQVARELPPKTEQTLYCELDANQRRLYNELRDHYREAVLGRVDRDGMARSRIQILEALLRLRQAACHPGLIDAKRVTETSAKLEALLPQLAEVIEEGHKALVFSQFTSFLAILRKQLGAARIAYEYLDGQTRDREACVDRFQNDPECRLFLVSLKAGGLGLNLCAAEYVFLLDPWWNPAVEAQAIDRAHRIGQTNAVFAYRLIARETVEEKVIELQNTKRALADAIIRADTRLVGNLNRKDLEMLLS